MASLQSRLDEFKKAFESGAPPNNAPREAIEKMHRTTAKLKASGIEEQALTVGDRAHDEPEYRLPIPARYVVDKQGIIRAADVNAEYAIRPEPSETLRQLRMLTG